MLRAHLIMNPEARGVTPSLQHLMATALEARFKLGVTETQWGRFVDREISPRFPDGLTVFEAKGEWRDTVRKTIVHEPSKVVEIVLPGKPDDVEQLNQIAQAYKSRFRQQSVGIVMRGACVSF